MKGGKERRQSREEVDELRTAVAQAIEVVTLLTRALANKWRTGGLGREESG